MRKAYSAESLDFFDVVLENLGLGSLVEAVEFGQVVDLNLVFDPFRNTGLVSSLSLILFTFAYVLNPAGR